MSINRTEDIILSLRGVLALAVVTVLLLQVQTVSSQNNYAANGMMISTMPFCVGVPETLRPGKIITVTAAVKESIEWLHFNLNDNCNSTKQLRLILLFNEKKVVRGVYQNGYLEGNLEVVEGEDTFPFSAPGLLEFSVEVQQEAYMVTGNGVPLFNVTPVFPYSEVSAVEMNSYPIGSAARIWRIEILDETQKAQPGSGQLIYPVPLVKSVSHPTMPFWGKFPDRLGIGQAIRIQGRFLENTDRVTINLCADCFAGPIMFHLDIRFKFENKFNYTVLNNYIFGLWGTVQDVGPFPFKVGQPFTVLIEVRRDGYIVEGNGQHLSQFNHRLPYSEVTSMSIEKGPVDIWKVEFIDGPSKVKAVTAGPSKEVDPPSTDTTSLAEHHLVFAYFVSGQLKWHSRVNVTDLINNFVMSKITN